MCGWRGCVFFFNDTATTEIYTLSLHAALPIYLVAKPGKTFRGVAKFLGLPVESARLKRAIRNSSFKALANQEKKRGFVEAVPIDNRVFFRKGKVGDWRNHLSPEQARRLIDDHREVMRAHGYLKADDSPVF